MTIDPKVALALLAVVLTVYGAKKGVGAVGHLVKRTAQVVSQPLRHPVKDAKVTYHKVRGQ